VRISHIRMVGAMLVNLLGQALWLRIQVETTTHLVKVKNLNATHAL
jgi:hypothetical protein